MREDHQTTALSRVLERLYAPSDATSFHGHVLGVLKPLVSHRYSGCSIRDVERHRVGWSGLSDPSLKEMVPIAEEIQGLHPFERVYQEVRSSAVITTTDLMSVAEWKENPFYARVHRKLGVVHDTSLRFYKGAKCVVFFFAGRAPMNAEELGLLRNIAPHLRHVYELFVFRSARRLESARRIEIDENGRVGPVPSACRAYLEHFFQRERGAVDELPPRLAGWLAAELKTFRENSFTIRSERRSLEVALVYTAEGRELRFREREEPEPVEILKSEFNLTQRESEVLWWASQGKTNGELAPILGISAQTARKHMEHVLRKLNCENRGSAAYLALSKLARYSMV